MIINELGNAAEPIIVMEYTFSYDPTSSSMKLFQFVQEKPMFTNAKHQSKLMHRVIVAKPTEVGQSMANRHTVMLTLQFRATQ